MNCRKVQESIAAFTGGVLSGGESRAIREHLASCPECASRLAPSDVMEILPVLDEAIEPSEDFALRFHARLRQRRCHTAVGFVAFLWRKKVFSWKHPWRLAASGIVAAVLVAGILLLKYPNGPRHGPEYSSDIAIAEKLPLLEDMPVISNLDLLEDFDAIEELVPGP